MLQFGVRDPALDYRPRPTAFGLVFHDGKLACVRVDRAAREVVIAGLAAIDANAGQLAVMEDQAEGRGPGPIVESGIADAELEHGGL